LHDAVETPWRLRSGSYVLGTHTGGCVDQGWAISGRGDAAWSLMNPDRRIELAGRPSRRVTAGILVPHRW